MKNKQTEMCSGMEYSWILGNSQLQPSKFFYILPPYKLHDIHHSWKAVRQIIVSVWPTSVWDAKIPTDIKETLSSRGLH